MLRESGSGTLEVIAAALAARGIRLSQLDVTMRLGSTEGIKAFVRNSDAMAIVSVISVVDELRSGALRIVDIEGLTLSRDFVFVHAEAEPARLARRFIDFAGRISDCRPPVSLSLRHNFRLSRITKSCFVIDKMRPLPSQ